MLLKSVAFGFFGAMSSGKIEQKIKKIKKDTDMQKIILFFFARFFIVNFN